MFQKEDAHKIIFEMTPLIKDLIDIVIKYANEIQIEGVLYKNIKLEKSPLSSLCGIVTDGTNIYITDVFYDRIIMTDEDCNLIKYLSNELNQPRGLAIDDSYIYIADFENKQIQIFNFRNANFVHKFNCDNRCSGVSVDKSLIYVSYHCVSQITIHTFEGKLINKIDYSEKLDFVAYSLTVKDGKMYMVQGGYQYVFCLSIDGMYAFRIYAEHIGGKKFKDQRAIQFIDDSLYVGDQIQVQQFKMNSKGEFLFVKRWGEKVIHDVGGLTLLNDKCYVTNWNGGNFCVFR